MHRRRKAEKSEISQLEEMYISRKGDPRILGTLLRQGCHTLDDVYALTIRQMFSFPAFGTKTILYLLDMLDFYEYDIKKYKEELAEPTIRRRFDKPALCMVKSQNPYKRFLRSHPPKNSL